MAASIPETMKAWTGVRLGEPRRALQLQTRPTPAAPTTGSTILVRVSHAALNPADVFIMSVLTPLLPFRRSPVPGLDFAGTVVAAGPDSAVQAGARVCGAMSYPLVITGAGSLAEYVAVPAELVAEVPQDSWLGLREAAGLGIVGQTALIAVREAALTKGQRVLVNGASGGLGSMIVQMAKGTGAWVVGVCSGANVEMVKGLGADETIDYTAHDPLHVFLAETRGEEQFDHIFDCVGHQTLYEKSPSYLKPEGKFITLVGGKGHIVNHLKNNWWPKMLGGTPRTFRALGLHPAGEYMREVIRNVEQGVVKKVPIDSEYNFEDAIEAYERVISKRSKGKVIVKVSP